MENVFNHLISFEFLALCVVIGGVIGAVGQIGAKKNTETCKWEGGVRSQKWFQITNPLMPYVLGVGICLIPGVPLPTGLQATLGAKVLFGLLAAVLSDKVYTVAKRVIVTRLMTLAGGKKDGSPED